MTAHIDIPMDEITAFCARWKIVEFSLFGSVLREDFGPDSDVDVLVTFGPDADWGLLDRVEMVEQLKDIFGRSADMAVEKNLKNPFRRKEILRTKEVVYAA